MTATVVLDATGTVVGSAGMVFKATGGSQGWPGCRRGYRKYCPGYYTPEKVSYTLLEGQQRVRGGGGVYYTELHYFTLHFWLFLCMV